MDNYDVSLLIPAYNEESSILKCLNSVNNQLLNEIKSMQVIVIPNGCNDNTLSITNDYISSLSKTVPIKYEVINVENGGKINALNIGLKRTKSKIVMYMDSDCFVARDTVENVYRVLTQENMLLVGALDKPIFLSKLIGSELYKLQSCEQIYREENTRVIAMGRFMGFYKECINEFPINIASDDTWISLYIAHKYGWNRIKVIEQAVVFFAPPTNWGEYIEQETRFRSAFNQLIDKLPHFLDTYSKRRDHITIDKKVMEININMKLKELNIEYRYYDMYLHFIRKIFFENVNLLSGSLVDDFGRWKTITSTKIFAKDSSLII